MLPGAKNKQVFISIFKKALDWARPYLTWKMLPFLLTAWFLTNGWSYAFVIIGGKLDISWMVWLGGVWIAFLWFPFTIEKPITLFIAGLLYKIFYRGSK